MYLPILVTVAAVKTHPNYTLLFQMFASLFRLIASIHLLLIPTSLEAVYLPTTI